MAQAEEQHGKASGSAATLHLRVSGRGVKPPMQNQNQQSNPSWRSPSGRACKPRTSNSCGACMHMTARMPPPSGAHLARMRWRGLPPRLGGAHLVPVVPC